ncbi:hypothetical protein HZH66_001015 [Vespula vulgaris]|uniref:Uncharacterized protein n=1 Tax=Vespula vulgaris TaxID=7454 RepID=A0A834KQ87_VESVU|nr:hypothetical protein HZH66_001015 [Vespula vulgaris]
MKENVIASNVIPGSKRVQFAATLLAQFLATRTSALVAFFMANDTGKEQSNAVFLSVLEIKDAWSVGHRSVTEEEEFETGRGHEGVAPRCATLRHTLHQLRRFKGKDRHRRYERRLRSAAVFLAKMFEPSILPAFSFRTRDRNDRYPA